MKKYILLFSLVAFWLLVPVEPALAAPSFVTSAQKLLQDVLTWLQTLIIPAGTGLMVAYHAMMNQFSDDEGMQRSRRKSAIIKTLIGGGIAETASLITSTFLGYF